MQRHLAALIVECINAVGIRAGESEARSKLTEWEWSDFFDCDVWRPLINWSEQDVIDIHRRHGLSPNPLYLRGASRVGCWPCIFARKAEIKMLADLDPLRVDMLALLEQELSDRSHAKRTWFHASSDAQNAFSDKSKDADKFATLTIREAVEWARTSRGGRQFEMFAAAGREAGCVRWGMCDIGDEP